jgi:N-methylhydantoinase B
MLVAAEQPDTIRVEVIRHALLAAAGEMKVNLARTAHNPIIYEVLDFSCGIFDDTCRTIAQADGLPSFLGNLGIAVSTVVDDIGRENLRSGDIYLLNDPYAQGMHMNDVTTVQPVFVERTLVGFAATRAHWIDIGAVEPGGSMTADDIVQEGIWLRSVRLYAAGRRDDDVLRAIRFNVRMPESMLGDLNAQVASSRTGARRMEEIVRRHGRETVSAAVTRIIDQGERRVRAAVRAMNDGVYEAETALDDDCRGNGPLPIRVRVTVSHDEVEVDLSGSAPANRGPVNSPLPSTLAACRVVLKAFTNPHLPATEGDFAPLRLVVPPGSMFDVRYPSPVFMISNARVILADLLVRALSQAAPVYSMAGHYGNLFGFTISGSDPRTGRMYIHQEPQYGGWGATRERDGESAMIFMTNAGCRVLSTETLEARFPLRVTRFGLRPDSAGPGRWRGGLGTIRDYRLLDHDARVMVVTDRKHCPPWGVDGGRDAQHCIALASEANSEPAPLAKAQSTPVTTGTLISLQAGGGGGYGNPFERDPDRVRSDVIAGYVSVEAAREDYGVALDPTTLAVDGRNTKLLRNTT